MQHRHFVSLFVLRPKGDAFELLLGKRAPEKYLGETWQLITGAVEPDETGWQAALREVREEAGLVVRELFRLSTLTHFYHPDLDAIFFGVMFCAFVAPDAVEQINPEHTELRWVSLDEARQMLMWSGDFAALTEVREQIIGHGPRRPHLRIELSAQNPSDESADR